MAMYESQHTTFMRDWLANNPREAEVQKTGRAMWWDKAAGDVETQQRQAVRLPRKAYYYDAN